MQTERAKNIYKSVPKKVLFSTDPDTFRSDNLYDKNNNFVGIVQLYSDQTATTLKATDIVAYPVHTVLLNFTTKFHHYLTDNRHALVSLLPVSTLEISGHDDCGKEDAAELQKVLKSWFLYQTFKKVNEEEYQQRSAQGALWCNAS